MHPSICPSFFRPMRTWDLTAEEFDVLERASADRDSGNTTEESAAGSNLSRLQRKHSRSGGH
ncbi:hypothetical protein, partial [Bordetella avium]|uniref:hypothetical protein n=1 Tax=Bordetella avium TaxID=521 RepID=UPI00307DE50C